MKAYFVTGTDTGVGKTTVGVGLLAAAARRGLRAGSLKPAESGCQRSEDGALMAADAEALWQASNVGQSIEEICLYCFEAAVAPGVAAAEQGVSIDPSVIVRAFKRLARLRPDLVLVEGAGGLLVPFGDNWTAADLARQLNLPLLIVSRPGLGTINHTLLTIEVARMRGLSVTGFVFSNARPDTERALLLSNADEICKAGRAPYLGCVPFVASQQLETLATAADPILEALLDAP